MSSSLSPSKRSKTWPPKKASWDGSRPDNSVEREEGNGNNNNDNDKRNSAAKSASSSPSSWTEKSFSFGSSSTTSSSSPMRTTAVTRGPPAGSAKAEQNDGRFKLPSTDRPSAMGKSGGGINYGERSGGGVGRDTNSTLHSRIFSRDAGSHLSSSLRSSWVLSSFGGDNDDEEEEEHSHQDHSHHEEDDMAKLAEEEKRWSTRRVGGPAQKHGRKNTMEYMEAASLEAALLAEGNTHNHHFHHGGGGDSWGGGGGGTVTRRRSTSGGGGGGHHLHHHHNLPLPPSSAAAAAHSRRVLARGKIYDSFSSSFGSLGGISGVGGENNSLRMSSLTENEVVLPDFTKFEVLADDDDDDVDIINNNKVKGGADSALGDENVTTLDSKGEEGLVSNTNNSSATPESLSRRKTANHDDADVTPKWKNRRLVVGGANKKDITTLSSSSCPEPDVVEATSTPTLPGVGAILTLENGAVEVSTSTDTADKEDNSDEEDEAAAVAWGKQYDARTKRAKENKDKHTISKETQTGEDSLPGNVPSDEAVPPPPPTTVEDILLDSGVLQHNASKLRDLYRARRGEGERNEVTKTAEGVTSNTMAIMTPGRKTKKGMYSHAAHPVSFVRPSPTPPPPPPSSSSPFSTSPSPLLSNHSKAPFVASSTTSTPSRSSGTSTTSASTTTTTSMGTKLLLGRMRDMVMKGNKSITTPGSNNNSSSASPLIAKNKNSNKNNNDDGAHGNEGFTTAATTTSSSSSKKSAMFGRRKKKDVRTGTDSRGSMNRNNNNNNNKGGGGENTSTTQQPKKEEDKEEEKEKVDNDDEAIMLYSIFVNFCSPPPTLESSRAILDLERERITSNDDGLEKGDGDDILSRKRFREQRHRQRRLMRREKQQLYRSSSQDGGKNNEEQHAQQQQLPRDAVISVLRRDKISVIRMICKSPQEYLLRLPLYFQLAFFRIIIRLLTNESDEEYDEECFLYYSQNEEDSFDVDGDDVNVDEGNESVGEDPDENDGGDLDERERQESSLDSVLETPSAKDSKKSAGDGGGRSPPIRADRIRARSDGYTVTRESPSSVNASKGEIVLSQRRSLAALRKRQSWMSSDMNTKLASSHRIKGSKVDELYSVVRFRCGGGWGDDSDDNVALDGETGEKEESVEGEDRAVMITNTHAYDSVWGRGAVYALIRLLELVLQDEEEQVPDGAYRYNVRQRQLIGPIARLLGLTCSAGISVKELRYILCLITRLEPFLKGGTSHLGEMTDFLGKSRGNVGASQEPVDADRASSPATTGTTHLSTLARLHLIRALTTAAEGASQSTRLLGKASPRCFFTFGRGAGMVRTVNNYPSWPFRSDFGMAVWFRAERFDGSDSEKPTLLSIRTEDGGGIEISLEVFSSSHPDGNSHLGNGTAATLLVTVFDSGHLGPGKATSVSASQTEHSVRLQGCVLSPRVWYHVAVRHTRPRLKGYLTLSLHDEVSIMLDGKVMLTEPLKFPKLSKSGGSGESVDASPSLLRRNTPTSIKEGGMNFTIKFGSNFDGQTGALYVFKDQVSDATLQALFEVTAGTDSRVKMETFSDKIWDSHRRELARKVNAVNAEMMKVDTEEIVVSKQEENKPVVESRRAAAKASSAVLDLAEDETRDERNFPPELLHSSFGSRLFLVWNPNRTSRCLSLETHSNLHVTMDAWRVQPWYIDGAKDVIGSIGGVQALLPLFRVLLSGEIERLWEEDASNGRTTVERFPNGRKHKQEFHSLIPSMVSLLGAFLRDHEENAREMLRCGGIEIVEQSILENKWLGRSKSKLTKSENDSAHVALNSDPGKPTMTGVIRMSTEISAQMVDALLNLRAACAHNLALETKVFSRLLFNIPLWLGGTSNSPGVALHVSLLPVLSSLAKSIPNKVRDCVGVKDLVESLREYFNIGNSREENAQFMSEAKTELFDRSAKSGLSKYSPLTIHESRHVVDVVSGIIVTVLAPKCTTLHLSPLLNFISYNLDLEWEIASVEAKKGHAVLSRTGSREERYIATGKACTMLLFLLQSRPRIPYLYESLEECFTSSNGVASWILCAMVNSFDDFIRSLGVRCLTAFLDGSHPSASALSIKGAAADPKERKSSVVVDGHRTSDAMQLGSSGAAQGAATTLTKTMKYVGSGLGVIGNPSMLSNILVSSKLNVKVVYKLLWHLLKCHRDRLGNHSYASLLQMLVDDGALVASSVHLSFLIDGILVSDDVLKNGYMLNKEWEKTTIAEVNIDSSRNIRNTFAVSTVLRLLRFLQNGMKEQLLFDLLTLIRMNTASINAVLPCTDWQPCLFHIVSEIVEEINTPTESHTIAIKESKIGVIHAKFDEGKRMLAIEDNPIGNREKRIRDLGAENAGVKTDEASKGGKRLTSGRRTDAEAVDTGPFSPVQRDQEKKELSAVDRLPLSKTVQTRYDLALKLYSTLLGHCIRLGGDKAFHSMEQAASLQRVCVNGHEVYMLILSHVLAELIENGTVMNVGTTAAGLGESRELNRALKQSARIVTTSILSNGADGMDMASAVKQWRCLRHLTAITVAVVTKSGFGVAELFDYRNQNAAAVDEFSGGLHGIRLPDTNVPGIPASEAIFGAEFNIHIINSAERSKCERESYRRVCVTLASQLLCLLDAFIFPDSLDESLPASQLHGLALVRSVEPRLGQAQGPLLASLIRLSLLLLSHLEPSSVKFLQCCSRLRCFLHWTLELIRESVAFGGYSAAFQDLTAPLDRLVLSVVLQCHRAFSRCSAVLIEMESSPYEKYFTSEESRKKNYKRLLRAAMEIREIILAAYRGRNEVLRAALSLQAYEALQAGLEEMTSESGEKHPGHVASSRRSRHGHLSAGGPKEASIRAFMSNMWVTGFHDVEIEDNLAIPEQVANGQVYRHRTASNRGRLAVEELALESKAIVEEYNKALNTPFEAYCEDQRQWAETDAVRDLEYEGDCQVKRLSAKYRNDLAETLRLASLRAGAAARRWSAVERKINEPWSDCGHWKLAKHADRLHRRILLVKNRHFQSHQDASYEMMLGREREKAMKAREEKLRRRNELEAKEQEAEDKISANTDSGAILNIEALEGSKEDEFDMMLRAASEGIVRNAQLYDPEDISLEPDDADGDSSLDDEQGSDGGVDSQQYTVPTEPCDSALGADWDQIEAEDIDIDEMAVDDTERDMNAWAKAFIWSDGEYAVCLFESVLLVTLQTLTEGKLLLTSHGLYFHPTGDEINVMTKERVVWSEDAGAERRDRRWRLSRLTEVHGRRYMLRAQAVELFFSDTHELFINFNGGTRERDKFYSKVRHNCKVPMLCSPKSLNPRTVFKKSKLTELWQKRKISNFQYLMQLNIMAGRTFNDITQYPVFPWVLADYTSTSLDLNDSRVFRDLSKPIGALNPDRLAQLIERFHNLDGFPEEEKFLYGSHYSSPGVVLHYLIRQEPFTTMAIELQSGRFDCPDRLFFDVAECWKGCLTSTSDVKELIPEFFTCPELFLNTNKFPLGKTQAGMPVDDVKLPPWAKGSPYEFVRIHRLALESEYVSKNLNHWVDLIFGYKQRGPEAAAAHNVFHYLSYEGSVNLDKITDEVDRTATESHIQNFGQTPSQLLVKEPHPSRCPVEECWKPLFDELSSLKQLRCHTPERQFGGSCTSEATGAVLSVNVLADIVIVVYADLSVGTYRLSSTQNGKIPGFFRMEKLRRLSCRIVSMSPLAMGDGIRDESSTSGFDFSKNYIPSSRLEVGSWCFGLTVGGATADNLQRRAAMGTSRSAELPSSSLEASSLLLSCGYWDNTVKVHTLDGLRLRCSENGGHHGPINCLDIAEDGALMLTGGQDATCRVWVVDHADMSAALSDGYVQTALGNVGQGAKEKVLSCAHVLWGHEAAVTCLALSSDLDVALSGSADGAVCVHTVRRGKFIRSIYPDDKRSRSQVSNCGNSCRRGLVPVRKLALDGSGLFVAHLENGMLHTCTVNGAALCYIDAGEKLNAMEICSGGEMLVSGGESCRVVVRTLNDLSVCSVLDLTAHGPIRCISFTPAHFNLAHQFMYIGTDDGKVTVVDKDPLPNNMSARSAPLWKIRETRTT